MAFNTKGLQVFHKPWFHGAPQNAKKASATIAFSDVVSDREQVVIGDNTYEFDRDNNLANGLAIQADMTKYLTKATATLTYIDIPVVTKVVTVGAGENLETYEIVAEAGEIADPANIPVALGTTLTADNAVTVLASTINANSALVTAIPNTITDTVVITAIAGGTGANTLAITTTETNASFGVDVTTLSGGLNTCTPGNAAKCLASTINATDEVVSAVLGADTESVIISNKLVGTEGNSVAVSTTCANGSFGAGVTALSGGQYATPCNASSAVIVVSNTIYFTDKPCTKWTEDAWYSATPTLL